MATSTGFRWDVAPSAQLVPGLDSYERRLIQAIGALADSFAPRLENYAKQNAPWTDRTGTARGELRGFTVKAAMQVTIYLVHGVRPYGIFLELGTRNMAPRPIIMPTLQAHHAPIMAALRALVGG